MVGIIGMLLIVLGWLTSMRNLPPLKLSVMYCAGSALLTYHAYIIGDAVFILLNAAATTLSLLNIARHLSRAR